MVTGAAAIALGMIFMGTRDDEIFMDIYDLLSEMKADILETNSVSLYYALCLGLLYFKTEEDHETALEVVETLKDKCPKLYRGIGIIVEACAYAGTGNVLQIQKLLAAAGEHPEEKKEKTDEEGGATDASGGNASGGNAAASGGNANAESEEDEKEKEPEIVWHQMLAVIGLALVALGEKYGNSMLVRVMNHLCQYGEPCVRRAVPLCLAISSVSHPELVVTDLLSKLSHDNDMGVVNGAILALGLVSAGTNNSRVAGLLRQLMQYYQKNQDQLFLIRIALGLLHMGKGLVTLSPIHSHGMLLSKTG
eukprot:UN02059